jgi:hypothetical protein
MWPPVWENRVCAQPHGVSRADLDCGRTHHSLEENQHPMSAVYNYQLTFIPTRQWSGRMASKVNEKFLCIRKAFSTLLPLTYKGILWNNFSCIAAEAYEILFTLDVFRGLCSDAKCFINFSAESITTSHPFHLQGLSEILEHDNTIASRSPSSKEGRIN